MQGSKNWILPKEMNANRFFWDSRWQEIWSNHFCPSMGPNWGSVAMDSVLSKPDKQTVFLGNGTLEHVLFLANSFWYSHGSNICPNPFHSLHCCRHEWWVLKGPRYLQKSLGDCKNHLFLSITPPLNVWLVKAGRNVTAVLIVFLWVSGVFRKKKKGVCYHPSW